MARWRALAFLSLAQLLTLSLWFSASAVLPALSREWQLGDGGRAGLTIAVQLGFILIWLIPPAVTAVGWAWAFATLAIGPALGAVAMGRLRALPESLRLANGRR